MLALYLELGAIAFLTGYAALILCLALFRVHQLLPCVLCWFVLIKTGLWEFLLSLLFIGFMLPAVILFSALGTCFFYGPRHRTDEIDYFLAFINLFPVTYLCFLLPLIVPRHFLPPDYLPASYNGDRINELAFTLMMTAAPGLAAMTRYAYQYWRGTQNRDRKA